MSAYATALSESSREALLEECLRQHDRAEALMVENVQLREDLEAAWEYLPCEVCGRVNVKCKCEPVDEEEN